MGEAPAVLDAFPKEITFLTHLESDATSEQSRISLIFPGREDGMLARDLLWEALWPKFKGRKEEKQLGGELSFLS